MYYNFKTIQKKEKGSWTTKSVINGNSVPFMLIDDMTAKYLYKQNILRIEKDYNGIIVYYDKNIRAVYSENGSEII